MSLAAVMLAFLPAVAAAQSAGDEQYEDPFAGDQGQAKPTPTPRPAPAAAAPAQATATPAAAAPAPQAAAPAPAATAGQLPRTGEDAVAPGAIGAILLAAGVALRVRVRRAP